MHFSSYYSNKDYNNVISNLCCHAPGVRAYVAIEGTNISLGIRVIVCVQASKYIIHMYNTVVFLQHNLCCKNKYCLLLCTDHQIMADLLAHETKQTSHQITTGSFGPWAGVGPTATEYSSSSSSEDEGMIEVWGNICMED